MEIGTKDNIGIYLNKLKFTISWWLNVKYGQFFLDRECKITFSQLCVE